MIRIERAEPNPSRRTQPPTKQKPDKRPALLQRLFGTRKPRQAQEGASGKTSARGPSLAEQEMLIV
jgi:hypothetical protein